MAQQHSEQSYSEYVQALRLIMLANACSVGLGSQRAGTHEKCSCADLSRSGNAAATDRSFGETTSRAGLERTGLLVCRLTGNWLTGSCTRVTTQEVIIPRRLLHRLLLGRLETSAIGTPWDRHAPELQIACSVSSSLAEFVCKFSYQFSECTTAAHRHRGRHHLCRLQSSHLPKARFSWEG
jgi:hypothetical protein